MTELARRWRPTPRTYGQAAHDVAGHAAAAYVAAGPHHLGWPFRLLAVALVAHQVHERAHELAQP